MSATTPSPPVRACRNPASCERPRAPDILSMTTRRGSPCSTASIRSTVTAGVECPSSNTAMVPSTSVSASTAMLVPWAEAGDQAGLPGARCAAGFCGGASDGPAGGRAPPAVKWLGPGSAQRPSASRNTLTRTPPSWTASITTTGERTVESRGVRRRLPTESDGGASCAAPPTSISWPSSEGSGKKRRDKVPMRTGIRSSDESWRSARGRRRSGSSARCTAHAPAASASTTAAATMRTARRAKAVTSIPSEPRSRG